MSENEPIKATVVQRVANMARDPQGKDELRELLARVAGDGEVTLTPLGEDKAAFDLPGNNGEEQ